MQFPLRREQSEAQRTTVICSRSHSSWENRRNRRICRKPGRGRRAFAASLPLARLCNLGALGAPRVEHRWLLFRFPPFLPSPDRARQEPESLGWMAGWMTDTRGWRRAGSRPVSSGWFDALVLPVFAPVGRHRDSQRPPTRVKSPCPLSKAPLSKSLPT